MRSFLLEPSQSQVPVLRGDTHQWVNRLWHNTGALSIQFHLDFHHSPSSPSFFLHQRASSRHTVFQLFPRFPPRGQWPGKTVPLLVLVAQLLTCFLPNPAWWQTSSTVKVKFKMNQSVCGWFSFLQPSLWITSSYFRTISWSKKSSQLQVQGQNWSSVL